MKVIFGETVQKNKELNRNLVDKKCSARISLQSMVAERMVRFLFRNNHLSVIITGQRTYSVKI